MSDLHTTSTRALSLATGLAVAGVLLAACGSGSSSGSTSAGASTAVSAATSAAAGASGGSGTPAMVQTASGTPGTYVTDGTGRALYDFLADRGTTSSCYSSCATYWPPLLTTGAPQASGSAKSSLLGTTKRTDGTTQVTYGGHPLYTYAGDSASGDTKGQGLNTSGGLWWLVAPDGTSITGGSGSSPKSSSSAAAYHKY